MKVIIPYISRFFLVLAVICSLVNKVQATHIVGGEFELVHLKDFDYQLRMILYFDVVNGNPAAADPQMHIPFHIAPPFRLTLTPYSGDIDPLDLWN